MPCATSTIRRRVASSRNAAFSAKACFPGTWCFRICHRNRSTCSATPDRPYDRATTSSPATKRGGVIVKALIRHSVVLALVVAASWIVAPARALAQGEALNTPKRTAPPAATPRTPDGKVDFSGIWTPDRKFIYDINDALKPGETLPIQDWALKVTLERLSKDDPEALCLPAGVPRQAQ